MEHGIKDILLIDTKFMKKPGEGLAKKPAEVKGKNDSKVLDRHHNYAFNNSLNQQLLPAQPRASISKANNGCGGNPI